MVLETCGISVGSVGGVFGHHPYHHQPLQGGINENNNLSPYAGDYAPQPQPTTNNYNSYTDLDSTGLQYAINSNNNWQGK